MTKRGILRGLLQLIVFLAKPHPLTRDEKREQGLKYARYPGYGFRWHRGRRVKDDQEMAIIDDIAQLRDSGLSWHGVAATLLRRGVRTPAGTEWSPWRCQRAYRACVAARVPTSAAPKLENGKNSRPAT